MTAQVDVCIIVEGSYPYVAGGVSSWVHDLIRACPPNRPLSECTDAAKNALDDFTGAKELQDDLTLLVLRRLPR